MLAVCMNRAAELECRLWETATARFSGCLEGKKPELLVDEDQRA
jgi:hypothetical protein